MTADVVDQHSFVWTVAPEPTGAALRSAMAAAAVVSIMLAPTTAAPLTRSEISFNHVLDWTAQSAVAPARPVAAASETTTGTLLRPRATPPLPSTAEQVARLHRASGLTWDQLARLFTVSRRTVHNWAAGSRLNGGNAELLAHVSALIASQPNRAPVEVRSWLLSSRDGQRSVFDEIQSAAHRREPQEDLLTLRERLGLA